MGLDAKVHHNSTQSLSSSVSERPIFVLTVVLDYDPYRHRGLDSWDPRAT